MRFIHMRLTSISVVILSTGLSAQSSPPSPQPGEAPPPPARPTQPPIPNLQEKIDRFAEVVADTIARSHGAANWRQKTAVQTDLEITLVGRPVMNATIIHEVNRGRTRFTVKDGPTLVNDGQTTWITPATADDADAMFRIQIIPAILAAPFHLRDRAVQPSAYKVASVNRARFDSFKLTFTSHAGESVGDWRTIFSHPRTHLLHAVANVPLVASTTGGAASSRQCIVLDEYKMSEGVSLASRWTIWNWDNEVQGEPIGMITLTNIGFIVPPSDAFDKPSDAREIPPAAKPAEKPADKPSEAPAAAP